MMASAQVVETLVNTNNSPSQDYTTNPDNHSNHNIDSPGFKPFTIIGCLLCIYVCGMFVKRLGHLCIRALYKFKFMIIIICMFVYTYICMYVCMYTCMFVFMYVLHVVTCMYVCIFICV